MMNKPATFLHITDAHLSAAGVPFSRDDFKVEVPGISDETREGNMEMLLTRLAERLSKDHQALDGVFFSGDAQHRNASGGHERTADLLIRHLGLFGITPSRIVSVPGNHDVPKGSPPSSTERYRDFVRVWRDRGCVVPWLDGIDKSGPIDLIERHRLVADDASWAVFPINTSNWSQVTSVLPAPLSAVWDTIPERISNGDPYVTEQLRSQLQALASYDMARVSKKQLESLRAIVASTPQPPYGRQIRLVVMHHHLRSPTLREEVKPFADISNLEHVRAFLSGNKIDVLMHGHKHEHATYFDHIYSSDGFDMHRLLVVSGATFEPGREADAARLITLTGLPYTPEVAIEAIPLPRPGAEHERLNPTVRRLWVTNGRAGDSVVLTPGAPVVVEGTDLDEVYARACAIAKTDANKGTVVVHLDLKESDGEDFPLPQAYPAPADISGQELEVWFRELVEWWQLDRSQLEHRIPYIHGSRLRRYGGKVDQIRRVVSLLRSKPSSRAIAVLVDPFRDFEPDGMHEEFASFCLVEFRRREDRTGCTFIDAIAFYRAQELEQWWPVNVAELRLLQRQISKELGFRPGPITTLTADARTISPSPTQVAMPIVDRWLDQAPERLPLLADALLNRTHIDERHAQAIGDWYRFLAELRFASSAFNPDGIPVAIEGLRRLSLYLTATVPTNDSELRDFAQHLEDLSNLNEMFECSERERVDFDRWSPPARTLLKMLQSITDARLSGDASA